VPLSRRQALEEPPVITIGIDPHKSSHTAVALDAAGTSVGELRVPADRAMVGRMLDWAGQWPQHVFAVEGASGLGRFLAQRLVAAGETVIDVPSALAARTRVLERGHGRKTDGIDARSVALVAQHRPDLPRVARSSPSTAPTCRGSPSTTTDPCCGCCLIAATS
jgi:transposase